MNLITGAARGLGLAMHRALGGIPFTRGTTLDSIRREEPYDAIIHCAVNSAKEVSEQDAYGYVSDNLLLTQGLLQIPHKRFVYISSIDVYKPIDSMGLYAASKFMGEALVRKEATRPLIIRPATLLGPGMRPNTIYRMLTEPDAKLFLSGESRFSFVPYERVIDCVRDEAAEGVVTLTTADPLKLLAIAAAHGLVPNFGSHTYDVARHCPAFSGFPSSWTALHDFIQQLGPRYIGK